MKYATDEAMRTGMTLQKSYIDNGDSTNARALDDAKRELKASIDQNSHDIESVSKKVDPLIGIGSAQYYVAEYAKGSNDNTEIRHLGNKDILKNFGFVLLDTSDNKNITTKPKRLKDNNLLRFEDGTFAPTVGITTEQYNQCMANDIYSRDLDESSNYVYTLEYQAGQFDAAVQWEKDKALIKSGSPAQRLYILVPGADGNTSSTYKLVTHVLRPWETTETKYTIGIANLVDMYLLDNQVGDSGAYWKGIFLEPISWDGIDVTKHKLPPTAIGPCPVTTIQENGLIKTRNFFYLYNGMTNCQSDGGLLPNHDFWEKNRTYPRVNDMNQVNNMLYARNNNYDVTKPYPFAEGGYHATNTLIIALELLAGTRYLHQANLFGSGISSIWASNFFTTGGVRFRAQSYEGWTTKQLGDYSTPLEYNESGSTEMMSRVLYNEYPIEQCMESQMAASMATELGINPTTDPNSPNYFDFYDNTYYYMNVPGLDGLKEGRMNTRVYKYIQKTVSAYYDKAPHDFDIEVVHRMSLFNGANLSGDIFAYNGGGLEIVGSCTVDPDNIDWGDPDADMVKPFVGNKIDIYVEPDQTKWHSEKVISKNGLDQVFGFEALYRHVLETTNLGDSYTLTREGFTPWKTAKASDNVHGECYYQIDENQWGHLNQRVRIGSIFRGSSTFYYPSYRFLLANQAASKVDKNISGTVQALIEL